MNWKKFHPVPIGKNSRWLIIFPVLAVLPWLITILPFFGANNYTYSQLNLWLILAIVCLGLNLLTGVAGQISIGHAALFQIGAYIAGYLVVQQNWPFWLVIIVAGLGTGLVGLVLGLPSLRLSGPYLAVATFGFSVAIPQLLAGSQDIARLYSDPNDLAAKIGVLNVPKQNLPGFKAEDDLGRYFMFLVVFVVMLMLALNVAQSRTGRAFYAIRDSETAAQAMGVSLGGYKLLAFVVSAVYAGVAGSLFAFQVGQLDANSTSFSVLESILFLTAIIIGGLGSVWGAVLGSAVITILPPFINAVNDTIKTTLGSSIENFESIFYGLLILIFIYFMPYGVAGVLQRLRGRYGGKPPKEPAAPNEAVSATDLPVR